MENITAKSRSPNDMIKVLILGSRGMLGQALTDVFRSDQKYETIGLDREEIDLTDFEALGKELRRIQPEWVINAAAYNAVDQCETDEKEYDRAMLLNATLPGELAHLSRDLNFTLVHYSTDYVFDGLSKEGYKEDALPQPLSRYGETKWAGEKLVLEGTPNSYVIRLSKLFGKPARSVVGKKSFFQVMWEKAKTGEPLMVVDAEKSCFTYAPDLAQATKSLLEEGVPGGYYHLTNVGPSTWYEAATTFFRIAGLAVTVQAVPPEKFPRPAKRPLFSVLRNTRRPPLRPYEEALKDFWAGMVQ